MYMSGQTSHAVKIRDKTINLNEAKELYGRLMVLAKSSRDINQKYAIGNYEFTLTPRALFAPSGSILPCTDKSKLIQILQKLSKPDTPAVKYPQPDAAGDRIQYSDVMSNPCRKIAVVGGVVIVQKITKKQQI